MLDNKTPGSAHIPLKGEVKQMIKNKGITIVDLAMQMGMKRQALDFHINGDGKINPKMYIRIKSALREVEKKIGIADEEDSLYSKKVLPEGNFYPILKNFLKKDKELDYSSDNMTGYAFFNYPQKDGCFCFINYGDQMSSESGVTINDEDRLLIDMNKKVMSNDIVLVHLQNGRELVRQLIEEGNDRVVLRCMNNKYSDIVIRKNDIKDIGRVCIIQAKAQII